MISLPNILISPAVSNLIFALYDKHPVLGTLAFVVLVGLTILVIKKLFKKCNCSK